MTRVLVCGGRTYGVAVFPSNASAETRSTILGLAARERDTLRTVLDKFHAEAGIDVIIQGGAQGADDLASDWARVNYVPDMQFDADWENQGSFAGPTRNKRMIEEGRPDLVIAFPGGKGTENMKKQARKAGIQVIEVGP